MDYIWVENCPTQVKYREVGALLGASPRGMAIDRAIFNPKFRRSPRDRYEILDYNENVIAFTRSRVDALAQIGVY